MFCCGLSFNRLRGKSLKILYTIISKEADSNASHTGRNGTEIRTSCCSIRVSIVVIA